MDNALNRIELFNNLFYIFAGIAAVSFILAVFMFFHFDIPAIYAMLTGKARRRTIEEMNKRNAQTGKMRMSYPIGHTGDTKGHTGRRGKTGNQKSGKLSGRTAPPRPQPPAPEPPAPAPSYPTPAPAYSPPAPAYTPPAYDPPSPDRPETGVLKEETPETMVLQSGPDGPINDSARTELLKIPLDPGFEFRVTENIIEIHTNELI